MASLTLYVKHNCGFSKVALDKVDELGLTAEKKFIDDNPLLREELIQRGGEEQVPYLIDESHGVEMYDSGLIAAYLDEHYGSVK